MEPMEQDTATIPPLTTDDPPKKTRKKRTPRHDRNTAGTASPANDAPPTDVVEKPSRDSKLVATWANYYTMAGMLAMGFDSATGHIIVQGAEARATELIGLAKKYPRLMKLLRQADKGGGVIAFVAGHGLMVYAILAAHDRVRPFPQLGIFGAAAYRPVPDEAPVYKVPFRESSEQPSYSGVDFDGN